MSSISERYNGAVPPKCVRETVECLLSTVPPGYLQGLSEIVLVDSGSLSSGKTRRVRGRKYRTRDCRGFYHPLAKGRPAYIEIVVDNTLRGMPAPVRWSTAIRELLLGEVLYHEIGHHLDRTIGARARTGEAAAESWSGHLLRQHIKGSHRLTSIVISAGGPLVRRVMRYLRRTGRW
jgi:hypothetical protein